MRGVYYFILRLLLDVKVFNNSIFSGAGLSPQCEAGGFEQQVLPRQSDWGVRRFGSRRGSWTQTSQTWPRQAGRPDPLSAGPVHQPQARPHEAVRGWSETVASQDAEKERLVRVPDQVWWSSGDHLLRGWQWRRRTDTPGSHSHHSHAWWTRTQREVCRASGELRHLLLYHLHSHSLQS